MTPPPSSSSSSSSAKGPAYDVLCETYLLRRITSFQRGFPQDIVEWMRANEHTKTPDGYPQLSEGLFPNLTVQLNDSHMLARLYQHHKEEQRAYWSATTAFKMKFNDVWRQALRWGNIEIADWIDRNAPELAKCDNGRDDQITLFIVLSSPGVEMTQWLLERRPRYKQLGHLFDLNRVAHTGNIELFQWLVDNIKDITTSPRQMDAAAREGHLDMVRYLHEHWAEGCTTYAMDNAARRGHLEVVKFLHEHRTEGCTTDAMDRAAQNGRFEVVKFLHENRKEGATRLAITFAVQNRHVKVVKFLLQNRTDGCGRSAIKFATEYRDLEMLRSLHERYPELSLSRALNQAARLGQLDIVQYIVNNTAQGCVFYCLRQAKELGYPKMEAYLIALVDPAIKKCPHTQHTAADTKRVCQKYKY